MRVTYNLTEEVVFYQLEKCKVCGLEYGFKVDEDYKTEMPVDYVKGMCAKYK
jgi:hypothetical protein